MISAIDIKAIAAAVRPRESFLPKYVMDLHVEPKDIKYWLMSAFRAGRAMSPGGTSRENAITAARAAGGSKAFHVGPRTDDGTLSTIFVTPENFGDWLEAAYVAGSKRRL